MEEQSRDVETRPPVTDGELHLLIGDLKDEVTRYRRREAAWISLIVHGSLVLALIFMPKWLPTTTVIVSPHEPDNAVFIPTSKSPPIKPPKTDIISDQDSRAQTRVPDKETLRKLLDARRPGPPKPAPQPEQPSPPQQAVQAPQQPSQLPPQPQTTETAKLEAPQPKQNPFVVQSPGASINQAIQSAANNHASSSVPFGSSGDRGSGIRPKIDVRGGMDILSDTMGVDFGAYMKRLRVTVEDHWYPLIPEDALPPMMKKGVVVIEFAIMKDGSLQGLTVVSSSGDLALDRAAYGALQNAVPLPRLPTEFSGPFLRIRAAFFYNPDKHDFE
jgi:TonB family protein